MKKLLIQLFIASIAVVSLIRCTVATEDLYPVVNPDLEAEIQNSQINNKNRESDLPDLPDVPKFQGLAEAPTASVIGMEDVLTIDPAKLVSVEQKISLVSDENRPALDLLFVIDNSKSMKPHQERLKDNIDQFVAGLNQLGVGLLDYRIGVTQTYDSTRYFKRSPVESEEYDNEISEWTRILPKGAEKPQKNFERLGKLVPLKNGDLLKANELGRNFKDSKGNVLRYVTPNTPEASATLADTLKVGYKKFSRDIYSPTVPTFESLRSGGQSGYSNPADYPNRAEEEKHKGFLSQEASSPRLEEFLAPMVAALNLEALVTGANPDYFRSFFPATSEYELEFPWDPPTVDDVGSDEKWLEFAQSYNQGFVREKAHLGIIFVTDTIDQSKRIDAELATHYLKKLKADGLSQVTTYGVLHKKAVTSDIQATSSQWNDRCPLPKDLSPDDEDYVDGNVGDEDVRDNQAMDEAGLLERFLQMTSGNKGLGENIYNLCSAQYGTNLKAIAEDLFVKSVSKGEYNLKMVPTDDFEVVLNHANPEERKNIPVCESNRDDRLCWKVRVRKGERKFLLFNQQKLKKGEILVRYKGIELSSLTNLNSK